MTILLQNSKSCSDRNSISCTDYHYRNLSNENSNRIINKLYEGKNVNLVISGFPKKYERDNVSCPGQTRVVSGIGFGLLKIKKNATLYTYEQFDSAGTSIGSF